MTYRFNDVPEVRSNLKKVSYLADEGIAGVVYLGDRLQKPVLVEGPAGTGKTQLAKSVAEMSGARLIRLQCYEGLDESKALYEWNYKKQLLRIQAERNLSGDGSWEEIEDDIFSDELPRGDVYILSRVLHDWSDDICKGLLKRIPKSASLVIIDRVAKPSQHGLLSLNMLLVTGGRERTAEDWNELYRLSGWEIQKKVDWSGHWVMFLGSDYE